MRIFHRPCRVVASIAVVAVLISCGGDIREPRVYVDAPTPTTTMQPTTTTTIDRAAVQLWNDTLRWNDTARWNAAAEALRQRVSRSGRSGTAIQHPAPASVLTVDGDYHSWPDWEIWSAIGRCEQGGDAPEGDGIAWHGQTIGGLPGSGYPGGLGIMRQAWTESMAAAGVTTVNGAHASPGDQIRVARVIRARAGLDAWTCGRKLFPGVQ